MKRDRLLTAVQAGAAAVAGLVAAAVAVVVLPTCSDLGGNPVYCVGGMGSIAATKLTLVALVAWWLAVRLLRAE